MRVRQLIALSVPAWLVVGVFWLVTTRSRHPTFGLAVITTAAIMVAYAIAAYINHLALIPRYLRRHQPVRYAAMLAAVMSLLTVVALMVIRAAYERVVGPEPDPVRTWVTHFGIDLFGMGVHLVVAAVVVRIARRWVRETAAG